DRGRIERALRFEARWKPSGKTIDFGRHVTEDGKRVGGRQLQDAESDRVVAVVAQIRGVAFGAQFRAADLFQAYQRAIRRALQDDVVELGRIGQTADGAHADVERLAGARGLASERAS